MSNETISKHVLNTPQNQDTPRVLKKRGRKGNKISIAFYEVPNIPVNFVDYAKKHEVSVNVLRQIKRHDHYTDRGKVFVRKNKQTKTMMIWREKPPEN